MKRFALVLAFFILASGRQMGPGGRSFHRPMPEWMQKQIQDDFAYFHEQGYISKSTIDLLTTSPEYERYQFVRYIIRERHVEALKNFSHHNDRVEYLRVALQELCNRYQVPNMEIIVTMHDELGTQFDVPVFAMAKNRTNHRQVLFPDFEALREAFKVTSAFDITKEFVSWEKKRNQMIWRGTTGQHPLKDCNSSKYDPRCYSRVRLCELSQQFPDKIDAKFTEYTQGAGEVPFLEQFRGNYVPYDDQVYYKYLMLIDGNSCSYTSSGWKWFTNSVVFKENSESIQWYYNFLIPYTHYIPVKEGLGDLLEKLAWARENDGWAKSIARNAREFALSHITKDWTMLYLYCALLEYSKIPVVD